MPMASPGVSVIICCYNSTDRLEATLQHLAAQQVPASLSWEVLVIDNASTDNTAVFAQNTWQQTGATTPLRVIHEPRAGQHYARNKGVAEAQYETLVFCDDDNWLCKAYVATAFEVMAGDAAIGAAGGRNEPVSNIETYPDWFPTYRDKYALGTPATASGDVSQKGFVLGAGMITRRTLFHQMFEERYPSLLNGRNGETLTTGDDFEYCKRLLLRGYKLYYDERLLLHHFIPRERLTIPYRERLMDGILQAGIVLQEYDHALRFYRRNRHKNRWRLLLLTPFRIWLAQKGWSKRVIEEEKLTLFYTAPIAWNPHPVRTPIKKFMYRR
ncbi:glycosyltransferase [Paraflavitalea sp. CAU 1676]|uniref:glycosyltransferase family 2 protein n=1 Tax=Paraflavitalea sp. CAU 1676 TaxID=3032598 RepID=UPI0023DBFEE2|nr:glycosyltransferase [Paraflavitalea sp. CAU 1676]MDF2190583.1 glycosyltransferase [Paraflavitalea sp. CAU 1676]